MCPVQMVGRAGTNMGRAAGRDHFLPKAVPRINKGSMPFPQRDDIKAFSDALHSLGAIVVLSSLSRSKAGARLHWIGRVLNRCVCVGLGGRVVTTRCAFRQQFCTKTAFY